jgi:hypothetical protein
MKLYSLVPSSRLAINIARISKKINLNVLTTEISIEADTLVVLADGESDDIAFSTVAFHLNGDKIAGIVKPERTRFGVIDLIPTYLTGKVRRILILMDREDEPLNTIYERVEREVKKIATGTIKVIEDEREKRLRVYKGKYGSREFELILVINGLDEIDTDKHCIEDHFVEVAKRLSIDVGDFKKSKEAWESLGQDQRLKIFKELKAHRKLVESVFPQQVQGCKYLMG